MKTCTRCNRAKPEAEFYTRASWCKPCFIADQRAKRGSVVTTQKRCRGCGEEKPIAAFWKDRSRDGRKSRCMECEKRRYAESHPESAKLLARKQRASGVKTCPLCSKEKPLTEFCPENGKA